MTLLIFAAALSILCALPFLRLVFKRILLVIKLSSCLKKLGGRLCPAHFFGMFGRRGGKTCDFYLVLPGQVIAVKLFNVLFRLSNVILVRGTYRIEYHIPMFSRWGSTVTQPFRSRAKPLPVFDCTRRAPAPVTGEPVLLIHPACFEIREELSVKETRIVFTGEVIGGLRVCSLHGLLKMLESRGGTA